jgi:hypothetical protein
MNGYSIWWLSKKGFKFMKMSKNVVNKEEEEETSLHKERPRNCADVALNSLNDKKDESL